MNEAVPAKAKRPKKGQNESIKINLSLDKKIEQDGFNDNENSNHNQIETTTLRVGFKALNSNRKESKTATLPGSDNLQPARPVLRARRRIVYAPPPTSSEDEADDTLSCKRFKARRINSNTTNRKNNPNSNGNSINNTTDAQKSARTIKRSKRRHKNASDLISTDGSDFEDDVCSTHKENKTIHKKRISKSSINKLIDLANSSKNTRVLSAKPKRQSHSTEDKVVDVSSGYSKQPQCFILFKLYF